MEPLSRNVPQLRAELHSRALVALAARANHVIECREMTSRGGRGGIGRRAGFRFQ